MRLQKKVRVSWPTVPHLSAPVGWEPTQSLETVTLKRMQVRRSRLWVQPEGRAQDKSLLDLKIMKIPERVLSREGTTGPQRAAMLVG